MRSMSALTKLGPPCAGVWFFFLVRGLGLRYYVMRFVVCSFSGHRALEIPSAKLWQALRPRCRKLKELVNHACLTARHHASCMALATGHMQACKHASLDLPSADVCYSYRDRYAAQWGRLSTHRKRSQRTNTCTFSKRVISGLFPYGQPTSANLSLSDEQ